MKPSSYILFGGLLLIVGFNSACSRPKFSEAQWRKQVEATPARLLYAPHEKDGVYFNPWLKTDKGFSDLLV